MVVVGSGQEPSGLLADGLSQRYRARFEHCHVHAESTRHGGHLGTDESGAHDQQPPPGTQPPPECRRVVQGA